MLIWQQYPTVFRMHYKVGQIIDAGGIIVTVDEGRLDMNIRRDCDEGEE